MRAQADSIVQALAATDSNADVNTADVNTAADESDETLIQPKTEKQAADNQNRSIILYQDDWHQGVIGIVAGRLKESHYLPSIVFAPADTERTGADDAIKGSARSIAGVHIRDAIEQVAERYPDLISHFGGHAMAAGLTIKRRNFDGLRGICRAEIYRWTIASG